MKNLALLILLLSFFSGCSKLSAELRNPVVLNDLSDLKEPFALSVDTLRGKKIRDFVTIVFKKGFDRTRWLQVFDKTKSLSKVRNDLIRIDDRLTEIGSEEGFARDSKFCTPFDATQPQAFEQVDDLRNCLLDTKLNLYADMGAVVEDIRVNDAAFLMVLDEGYSCEFSSAKDVAHSCNVTANDRKTQDRLGGLPDVTRPWFIEQPKVSDIWMYPWLEAHVSATEDSPGKFEMIYRLRAEQAFQHSLKLVGEVEVLKGSQFTIPGQPGQIVEHDSFGYTELTIYK